MRTRFVYCLGLIFLLFSCNTTKQTKTVKNLPSEEPQISVEPQAGDEDEVVITEERFLDTMEVVASRESDLPPTTFELPKYNPSHERKFDLLHTKLELSFDWEEELVLGKATLRLKPYFYSVDKVILDAKDFEFQRVSFLGEDKDLKYTYDDKQLTIELGKTFSREEEITLYIDYTASPAATGGSAAIQSDQGLFFINPRGEEPGKPRQIWTQGETEWNSKWFPTIDKPNERCTQEVYLTVDAGFKTLSNGLLVESVENGDGTRTDYWKMEQPHAPYLFMIAVGDFAVVKEEWQDIPVEYYVEPEYEKSAKAIFSHTPEMLQFFSDKLKLKYPWPKYSQIVVRDYVSGAMENTTASIFGEFVQKHERELIDNHNERIVAHELFHHWFGDYVTCESWANLTMNEGFANYSEYLWFEHKYGVDEADYHLLTEWGGYFSSSRNNAHPLIYFGHEDKEDMFDAHSYNKGGAVLHMLRNIVGADAFWAALNLYLTDNAYQAVEVHNLRLAFEKASGRDLNWFFNQWYLEQGHPQLNVTFDYDESAGKARVKVEQQQDPVESYPVFQLPVKVDIYLEAGKEPISEEIIIDQREQEFSFDVSAKPKLINFDADRTLLAEVTTNKTAEEYAFQFQNAPKFLDRFEALQGVGTDNDLKSMVAKGAIKDDFWVIRGLGIQSLQELDGENVEHLRRMATEDPHSQIRAVAMSKLSEKDDPSLIELAKKAIDTDRAYPVIATALDLLIQKDKPAAREYAQKLEDVGSEEIIEVIGSLYAESGEISYLPFFEKNLDKIDGFMAISFYESYQGLAVKSSYEIANKAVARFKEIATNKSQSMMKRLAATKSVNDMRNHYRTEANQSENEETKQNLEKQVEELSKIMEEIKSLETNSQLKQIYESRLLLLDKA